jgi:uncharacterized membrane protein
MDGDKYKVFEFAENHPHMLLVAVFILTIIVLVMYFGDKIWCSKLTKRKKKVPLDDDEEIDELIETIHLKQKKKKPVNC